MKKFYSFLMLTVLALVGFSASAARTVIVNCSEPSRVVLRDGSASGDILSFTENGQEVTFQGDALYVAGANDDVILQQVTFTGESEYYPEWGDIINGVCLIPVSSMPSNPDRVVSVNITLATPVTFYIQVPDPSLVTLTNENTYSPVSLKEGLNTIKVAPYTSFKLAVKDPVAYKLTEVWLENNPEVKFKVDKFSSATLSNYNGYGDGDIVAYTVIPASEFDAPTFELNIDEPSKVRVTLDYVQQLTGLSATEPNIIELNGESGVLTVNVVDEGDSIFKVARNGSVVNPTSNSYYMFDVNPNDVIDIVYNYPDVDFTFQALCEPTDDAELFTATVGGEPYTFGELVTAKAGTPVELTYDTNRGTLVSMSVNGVALSYPNTSYKFKLADNTVVEYVCNRFAELSAVINIDCPEAVTAEINYKDIPLTAGRNDITFVQKDYATTLRIKGNGGYVINSVTSELNGETKTYEESYYGYEVELAENMIINIEAAPLVKDTKAVVYANFDSSSDIFYNCYLRSAADDQDFPFGVGYTEIEYNQSQKNFRFNVILADWSTPSVWVYLNGEEQEATYGYSFTLENNSVLKLFLNEEPARYEALFEIASDAKANVTANLVEPVNVRLGIEDFAGTLIQVTNDGTADGLEVIVNKGGEDTVVAADAEGVFNVTLDADMTIKVNAGTGIAAISADKKAADVFTTTGVRVGNSTENLPAGIYIVGGKKVVVR